MDGRAICVVLFLLGIVGMAFAALSVSKSVRPLIAPREQNEPVITQGRATVTNNAIVQQLREKFSHRAHDLNALVRRALQRRAEVVHAVRVSREQIKRWKRITFRYTRFVQRIREIAMRYRIKLQEWARAKRLFEEGNITEEEYFTKAKDLVLAAIDAAIERLQALKENNVVVEEASGVDTALTHLEELRAKVEAAEDLNTLRKIYKEEVLPVIREYHNKVFFRFYVRGTIRAAQSIVARLDMAAARLARYVERAKEFGIYDEELDAKVTAIFAEIDAVKAELNELEAKVEAGEIAPAEYIKKINELKRDVYDIYRDIVSVIKDFGRKYAEHLRTRVGAEVNAKEVNE